MTAYWRSVCPDRSQRYPGQHAVRALRQQRRAVEARPGAMLPFSHREECGGEVNRRMHRALE